MEIAISKSDLDAYLQVITHGKRYRHTLVFGDGLNRGMECKDVGQEHCNSKYKLYLSTEEELRREIEQEKELYRLQQENK